MLIPVEGATQVFVISRTGPEPNPVSFIIHVVIEELPVKSGWSVVLAVSFPVSDEVANVLVQYNAFPVCLYRNDLE
jgi:hypothetical protein